MGISLPEFCLRRPLSPCATSKRRRKCTLFVGHPEVLPTYLQQGVNVLSNDLTLQCFLGLVDARAREQVACSSSTKHSSVPSAMRTLTRFSSKQGATSSRFYKHSLERRSSDCTVRLALPSDGEGRTWNGFGTDPRQRAFTHARVRNRHRQPCPRYGTTIRRGRQRGFETFFCQQAARTLVLDWNITIHTH